MNNKKRAAELLQRYEDIEKSLKEREDIYVCFGRMSAIAFIAITALDIYGDDNGD